MAKTIQLTQGNVAIIDDEDWPAVSRHKWCVHHGNRGILYAARNLPVGECGRKGKLQLLHQFILGTKLVDHRDGDGLNNRRSNLRRTTKCFNAANSRKRVDGRTSRFKGVSFDRERNAWKMQIKCGPRRVIKRFATEAEAARAYNLAAVDMFGEHARLNEVA